MSETETSIDEPRFVVGSFKHIFEEDLGTDVQPLNALTMRDFITGFLVGTEKRYIKEVTIYGDHEAHIIIPFSQKASEYAAYTMLGEDEVKMAAFDGRDLINETTNELTNQVSGCFRNILSKDEINCRLKPPRRLSEKDLAHWLNTASYRFIHSFNVDNFSMCVIYVRQ
ncbi:MAG: chemotaxis protein CheX [Opitutales bacterium]|nr:chemotaxis protein CheX [Opitutales bacterium]NRA25961.1 hypothetical protein [Opitutales bacterium]